MVREIIISFYLGFIKLFFTLFRFIPLNQDKITLVTTFGDNTKQVLEQLQHTKKKTIILKGRHGTTKFNKKHYTKKYNIESNNPISFIASIFHLATSKIVFVDNYFGFLAATDFKKEVKVVQLWHAAGAVKKFGLQDPSIKHRSKRANDRFQAVYSRFDHVVVGSDKMTHIFKESFGLDESHFLPTGIPRTDFFFQVDKIEEKKQHLLKKYPVIEDKKVILYAPTFREDQLQAPEIVLNFEKMFEHLRKDYVILLKLHPAIADHTKVHIPSFVLNVSSYPNINHLLTITDILITDYSSIPVEFSLFGKPMIFYPYDLEDYMKERGFWESYEDSMPGPIAYSTEDIIKMVKDNAFDLDRVNQYAQEWNQYSKGNSTRNLIEALEIK